MPFSAPHRLGPQSRQTSSNTSEGNNRESSLDDSGVVDDHEEGDATSEDVASHVPSVVRVNNRSQLIASNTYKVMSVY